MFYCMKSNLIVLTVSAVRLLALMLRAELRAVEQEELLDEPLSFMILS